jgi:dolichyl-phosphate beta-glucosyltransferase
MLSLSIVIPAYNEAARLPNTLELIKVSKEKGIFNPAELREVWIIDDGSKDQTAGIAQNFTPSLPEIRVHRVSPNQGKGNAIHTGLALVQSDWCLIADADSATPWDQFIPLSKVCFDPASTGPRIAMGSRDIEGSLRKERQSWLRESLGRLFNFAVRLITGLPFKDTQCGFKLIHMPSVRPFLPFLRVKRFAWDVEFLLFAKRAGIPMVEVPVVWEHQEGSRISPIKDGIEMFFRVIQMRLRIALFSVTR